MLAILYLHFFVLPRKKTIQSVNKNPYHVTVTVRVGFFCFPSPFPEHIPIIETAKQDGGSEMLKCR